MQLRNRDFLNGISPFVEMNRGIEMGPAMLFGSILERGIKIALVSHSVKHGIMPEIHISGPVNCC